MKRILNLVLMGVFLIGFAHSQTPNLDVTSKNAPNQTGIYEPQGTYGGKDYWLGPKPGKDFFVAYDKRFNSWQFGEWLGDTTRMFFVYYQFQNNDPYPTGDWNDQLNVSLPGPKLQFDQTELTESKNNDGSFTSKIKISHNRNNGQTFGGNDNDDFIAKGYAVTNLLPQGLKAQMIRLNDTLVELSLQEYANIHAIDTNFTVEFKAGALGNGGVIDSTQNTNMRIRLNFINSVTVGKSGANFTSITEALKNVGSSDLIRVDEGTYTEMVIFPNSLTEISIIGKGAHKTIIQADTAPRIAKDRVFNTQNTNTYFEGLTIQNGYAINNNGIGGGILSNGGLISINACRIIHNTAMSLQQGAAYGGGIMSNGKLIVNNSEISYNTVDNGVKNGQIIGGGITCNECTIENSTLSGNFARGQGGAVFMVGTKELNRVINSTLTKNEAQNCGGIYAQSRMQFINSIVYGNKSQDSTDIFISSGNGRYISTGNSIFGSIKGNPGDTAFIIGTPLYINPKLDTLKFNCGFTRTHALLSGSPAIDAGIAGDTIPEFDQRGYSLLNKKDIGAHENNNGIDFQLGTDSLCLGSTELLILKCNLNSGSFEGIGVNKNTFDPSQITQAGYTYITYTVDALGCENYTATDSVYMYACVNSTQKAELNVRIFPNPAHQSLWIENDQNVSMRYTIADFSGKVFLKNTLEGSKTEINIEGLPQGIYLITTVANGAKTHNKFIKL